MDEKYEKAIQVQASSKGGKEKIVPRVANQDHLLEEIQSWQGRVESEK